MRSRAAKKRDSSSGWTTITSRAFSPSPFWTTDLIDAPCMPRICGDLGEHARAVGDLEVQVEGRLDVVGDLQPLASSPGVEAGGIIALMTSPSTALAVCGPPAPGPDIVISVIDARLDRHRVVRAVDRGERVAGVEERRVHADARACRSTRSAVPMSFSPRPRSRAYSRSSAVMCSIPS